MGQSVELGKEIINSIVDYGHHEITHPGFVHTEVEVEEWKYKYLIGTKGSEMRHIQNSFHVKVNIPREHISGDECRCGGRAARRGTSVETYRQSYVASRSAQ